MRLCLRCKSCCAFCEACWALAKSLLNSKTCAFNNASDCPEISLPLLDRFLRTPEMKTTLNFIFRTSRFVENSTILFLRQCPPSVNETLSAGLKNAHMPEIYINMIGISTGQILETQPPPTSFTLSSFRFSSKHWDWRCSSRQACPQQKTPGQIEKARLAPAMLYDLGEASSEKDVSLCKLFSEGLRPCSCIMQSNSQC